MGSRSSTCTAALRSSAWWHTWARQPPPIDSEVHHGSSSRSHAAETRSPLKVQANTEVSYPPSPDCFGTSTTPTTPVAAPLRDPRGSSSCLTPRGTQAPRLIAARTRTSLEARRFDCVESQVRSELSGWDSWTLQKRFDLYFPTHTVRRAATKASVDRLVPPRS